MRVLRWLNNHKIVTGFLAIAYVAFVTLTHDVFQRFAFWAQDMLTLARWNRAVFGAGALLLATFTMAIIIRAFRAGRMAALIYGLVTVALSIVAFAMLTMTNIEIVHFPQYAFLALLAYPITLRLGETVFWTTLAGAVDEGFQYWYLHAHWKTYLDFNDIILNLIGAGFGVVALALIVRGGTRRMPLRRHSLRSMLTPGAAGMLGLLFAGWAVLYCFDRLSLYPTDNGASAVVFRRCGPPGSTWVTTEWGRSYYVVQPVEGSLIVVVMLALYFTMDLIPEHRRDTTNRTLLDP